MAETLGYQFDRVFGAPIEKYRQVATITARDAIPTGKRWNGMLCYVVSENTDYQLQGGTTNLYWQEVGSGAGFDLSTDTTDDITEGVINFFMTNVQNDTLNHITATNDIDLDVLQSEVDALGSGLVYKGTWDASSGSFPSSSDTGFLYIVSVAGTVDGVSFDLGDSLAAITDSASTTTFAGNWSKFESVSDVQSVAGLTGVISKLALLSAINVEDGATADQTGSEIASLLDVYLGSVEWRTQLTVNEVTDMAGDLLQNSTQNNITVTYNSTSHVATFSVEPYIQVYANLVDIIADEGVLLNYVTYEVTDASGFTDITSGSAWVRYLGTTNGDETDFKIISKEEGTVTGAVSTKEQFTSTESQTDFILNSLPTNVDVWLDRVPQIEGVDYTISTNIVTFTYGLSAGSVIIIRKY